MSDATVERASRRGIWGWMLFDWAAQPFFTVVTTFIFGPYFVSRMASDPATGQAAWGYGIAAAGLVIAVLSPVLGSIADQTGPRKPWIGFFAVIQIVSLSLLWFAAPGSSLFLVVLCFSLASVAAEFSTVFNDSMMPRLVPKNEIGRISNVAWGLGYLGGMVALIFVVTLLAASPETGKTIIGATPLFGLDPKLGEDARATGPLSALWYLVFILPMFFYTPDALKGISAGSAVREGLRELKATISEVRERGGIFRFLIARMLYQDGVNALLALGGAFAAAMFGWSITEIGIFGIISTGPGYTLFGAWMMPGEHSGGLFGTPAEKAYVAFGLLIGLAFGPVQASSRSYMARSVTAAEAGRYFGIYALAGRATSFAAPFTVATITALSGSPRLGMASIVLFLAAGMWILAGTPYPADRKG
jgi:UMF1 family MFS transporter